MPLYGTLSLFRTSFAGCYAFPCVSLGCDVSTCKPYALTTIAFATTRDLYRSAILGRVSIGKQPDHGERHTKKHVNGELKHKKIKNVKSETKIDTYPLSCCSGSTGPSANVQEVDRRQLKRTINEAKKRKTSSKRVSGTGVFESSAVKAGCIRVGANFLYVLL